MRQSVDKACGHRVEIEQDAHVSRLQLALIICTQTSRHATEAGYRGNLRVCIERERDLDLGIAISPDQYHVNGHEKATTQHLSKGPEALSR